VELSDSLSAIEFMDWESVAFSLNYFKIENPFRDTKYKYYLLIEGSSNADEEQHYETMLNLMDKLSESYEDAILCESEAQTEKIWKIREGISMATAHNGFVSLKILLIILFRQ
jgi:FAD/FMN-containing dehydrogenase